MNAIAHIGPSIRIKGEVSAKESLTVAGHIVGTIDLSGHALTVTEAALIDADVVAHTIIVGGSVKGKLTAEGRIVVQQTATVDGEVSAPSMIVDDGAVMHGRLDISGRRRQIALAV